jgi:hypothetical protein
MLRHPEMHFLHRHAGNVVGKSRTNFTLGAKNSPANLGLDRIFAVVAAFSRDVDLLRFASSGMDKPTPTVRLLAVETMELENA